MKPPKDDLESQNRTTIEQIDSIYASSWGLKRHASRPDLITGLNMDVFVRVDDFYHALGIDEATDLVTLHICTTR